MSFATCEEIEQRLAMAESVYNGIQAELAAFETDSIGEFDTSQSLLELVYHVPSGGIGQGFLLHKSEIACKTRDRLRAQFITEGCI